MTLTITTYHYPAFPSHDYAVHTMTMDNTQHTIEHELSYKEGERVLHETAREFNQVIHTIAHLNLTVHTVTVMLS